METESAEFIPPYPYRMPATPFSLKRVFLARRNLLSMFEEQAFEHPVAQLKALMHHVFLCNSPESVQFAFSTHNNSFERKGPAYRHALQPLLGDGLFVSDGHTWRSRRRIVAPLVHGPRMPQFAPIMIQAAQETAERWARLAPAELDMLSEMAQLTAEIICRSLFGSRLGRERALEVVKGFTDYQSRIGNIDVISLIGLPDWVPRPHLPGLYRSVRRVHAVLDDIIAHHEDAGDGGTESVVGCLREARDQETGAPLSAEAVRNEAAVLFMAGHETTANTLAWTWYILSQMPEIEACVHAEIDQVLQGRPPSLADLPKLIYTRAVVEEVLRLYPPVPILFREALRDETFQDHHIPKGSFIFVCPWLLHRHRQWWKKPDHFIPERFLPGSAEPISKFVYIPFSIGPRVCAGMTFGLTEAILCIATLAQAFRLRLKPGHRVEVVCRLTLRPGDKLPMLAIPRKQEARSAMQQGEPAVAPSAVRGCPVTPNH
jgi:cytochrome P450